MAFESVNKDMILAWEPVTIVLPKKAVKQLDHKYRICDMVRSELDLELRLVSVKSISGNGLLC